MLVPIAEVLIVFNCAILPLSMILPTFLICVCSLLSNSFRPLYMREIKFSSGTHSHTSAFNQPV